MPGVMPRALDDRVFGRSGLVLLAWFIIVCVSPVLAHYPESDKQLSAPDQGTVQSIKRTKLLAGDLLVVVERFSAKKTESTLQSSATVISRRNSNRSTNPQSMTRLITFLRTRNPRLTRGIETFSTFLESISRAMTRGLTIFGQGLKEILRWAEKMPAPTGQLVSAVQIGRWSTRRLISLRPRRTSLQTGDWSC